MPMPARTPFANIHPDISPVGKARCTGRWHGVAGTWLALAVIAIGPTLPARAGEALLAAYADAERVLDANLAGLVRNERVQPVWIGDGDRFWYRRDGNAGPEWLIVDAASGDRSPAFDPPRLHAAAVAAGMPESSLPGGLPVRAIEPMPDTTRVTLRADQRDLVCDTARNSCAWRGEALATDTVWDHDSHRGVFMRGHNLWLREAGGDEVRQLTRDGVAHFAYGARPGSSYRAIADLRATEPLAPANVFWSPDGARLIAMRYDEREVEPYPFLESVPRDGGFRPKVWQPRIALLGDAGQPVVGLDLVDIDTETTTPLSLPEGWQPHHLPLLQWSADGRRAWGLAMTRNFRAVALFEADLERGRTRLLIEERTDTRAAFSTYLYSPPAVRVLDDVGEAIWFSQRDGWGRLQLHDLDSGELKRVLTDTGRSVRDIIDIDRERRLLYYTTGGRDDDADPHWVTPYRVALDAGEPERLSDADAVHTVALAPTGNTARAGQSRSGLSPNGRWLVDTRSTLAQPPVSVIRATDDGRVIATLEQADAGAVFAAGWQPPTRVRLLSADGRTPIWATVWFPPEMAADRSYPVINATYGGPQVNNAPADFINAITTTNPISRSSLARLGFIVVTIDGRGTPGRSKAFNDHSYGGQFAEPMLADHVAGLRQLAERFGNLDLDRVGVYGHSFGGYVSARAILTHPDVFKVAVSSAGPHNFQGFYPVERFFGPTDYGDGDTLRPNDQAVPAPYDRLDSARFAANLRGKLLLVYGDLDENAFPAVTLQLIDALIRANRPHDLLYLPNQDHNFFRTDAYYTQRMWDYFVEHLLGETPPLDFDLTLKPRPTETGY